MESQVKIGHHRTIRVSSRDDTVRMEVCQDSTYGDNPAVSVMTRDEALKLGYELLSAVILTPEEARAKYAAA